MRLCLTMVESPSKEETAQKAAADEETPTTDTNVTTQADTAAAADPSAARKRRKAIIESQRKESEESAAAAAAAAAAAQQKETENEGASKTANSSVTGSDDGHTAHEEPHSEGESVTNNKKRKTKRTQIRYDPDVPMSKEQLAAWRREARRVRNRESAAASRQRIRNRITELETEVDEYKSKYHAALERLKELDHQQVNQNGSTEGSAPVPQAAEGKTAE